MTHLNANTDAAIEQLISAMCGPDADARQLHLCRESLRSLVRLAKSEYRMEITKNVDRVAGASATIYKLEEVASM